MTLRLGGFPEVQAAPGVADIWFRSYVQTYLERDARAITSIRERDVRNGFRAVSRLTPALLWQFACKPA